MNHILTQEQSNELTRDLKQIDYSLIPANVTIINGYPPFKRNMAALVVQVGIVQSTQPLKDVSHVGVTKGKMSLKVSFADYEEIIMNKVKAFAIDPDNITPDTIVALNQLEQDMTMRIDQIISMKDADIIGFANKIKTSVTPYLAQLLTQEYDVVAADLTLGVTMAQNFTNTIGSASMIEQGANIAGVNIEKAFVNIAAIQKSLALNLSHWKTLNPDFVQGWKSVSVVDHLGHSFTKLLGDITGGPSNIPLPLATVQNLRTLRYADVDILAHYLMQEFHAHLDNWEVSCPGFISKIQAIKTESGKALTVNFHLDPIVPAP